MANNDGYSARVKVKKRDNGMVSKSMTAVVDTTGMDPEMQKTLMGMRGASSAGTPAGMKAPTLLDRAIGFLRGLGRKR